MTATRSRTSSAFCIYEDRLLGEPGDLDEAPICWPDEPALAGLLSAVEARMSAALIAPAGTGKTALLRRLLSGLPEARYHETTGPAPQHVAYRGGRVAQVENVIVDPVVRGQRIGEAMMTWCIDEARRRGCCRIQLTTNKVRRRAHRFYERLGFHATHEGMKLPLRAQ